MHSLGLESYRNEVAECWVEFFNKLNSITLCQRLMKDFARKIEENIGKKSIQKKQKKCGNICGNEGNTVQFKEIMIMWLYFYISMHIDNFIL